MRQLSRHPRRNIAMVVLALAVGAAVIAAPGISGAAPNPSAASSSSAWLNSKLVSGKYENPLSGDPDYGVMIDALFAMRASGDPGLADPIVTVLDDDQEAIDFFSYSAFLGDAGKADRVGGATAKTLVAALVSRRDPHNFGGYDMVAETKGVITPDGPEQGRVRDFGPDIGINSANTFGQGFAVLGFAGMSENDATVIEQLLRQQCSEGYFRISYGYDPSPPNAPNDCDGGKPFDQSSPDGDATGFGLSALLAARRAGAPGLDDAIARATSWLVAHQDAGGGWGGGVGTEAPNTNSTGLVVQALADAGGATDAVSRGEAYVLGAQAKASDSGNDLRDDIGAIAYTPAEYVAARAGGIGSVDTWLRAGTQASLGLSQVGFFDLVTGHVPVAPTTTTTTTQPTSTSAPTAAPTTANGSGVLGTATDPQLANTGSDPRALTMIAFALLLIGAALLAAERHRHEHNTWEAR